MICPKCGFEQPDGIECMRCGIIVSRYKGPATGVGNTPPAFAPVPRPSSPSFIPPPPVIAGGAVHAPIPPPPAPANPGGGTLYGGPPLPPPPGALAGGGSVYGGPGSASPAFSSFPAFHGTFESGAIAKEVFSVYFSNIIPFALLATLALSPSLLLSAWATTLPFADPAAVMGHAFASLLQVLCGPIATAAITYGVYEQMRGSSPSIGACLKVGLATLFPLLGLAFIQGLGITLAFLLCVVPGIVLAVRWAVAIPSKVEERVTVGDALSRSTYLTDGYRWQVFGVLAIVGAINVGLLLVLMTVFKGKTQEGPFQFTASLVGILTTGLSATASAVMYYRLRSVKESVDVAQISSVFA